jgi:hypothetical protein
VLLLFFFFVRRCCFCDSLSVPLGAFWFGNSEGHCTFTLSFFCFRLGVKHVCNPLLAFIVVFLGYPSCRRSLVDLLTSLCACVCTHCSCGAT